MGRQASYVHVKRYFFHPGLELTIDTRFVSKRRKGRDKCINGVVDRNVRRPVRARQRPPPMISIVCGPSDAVVTVVLGTCDPSSM
jgi:hypothetical protein